MKGLLLNDGFILWKQCKLQVACIVIFSILSIIGDNQSFLLFVVLYGAILPQTIMAYNQKSNWNKLALTMPVTREQIVEERYLSGLMAILLSDVLCFISFMVKLVINGGSFNNMVFLIIVMSSAGLIINSLYLPIIYKFGVERARFYVIFLMAAGGTFAYTGLNGGLDKAFEIVNLLMNGGMYIMLLACLAVYVLSMMISIGIYSKKQL